MPRVASTRKSRCRPPAPADFDTIADDLAALKRDFARLMEQMKTGAIDGTSETVQNLMSQLNERASELYESMSDQGERSVKAISRHVEEQPITSLLVAFGVGMIAGRLLSR
jgi:ElaB/YqjD/DUF883 family membrane-anchored ribosome-binding protein